MSVRQTALQLSAVYFDDGHFTKDLTLAVAIPSESQERQGYECLQVYLDDCIIPLLSKMGFTCKLFENSVSDAGPFLLAERIENLNMPTILTYGHGDVVLGQHEHWKPGLSPFDLHEEGDQLYGRGTADNKGQHLINLQALASVLEVQGELGFNFKVLFETGEEIGSPGLKEFCDQHRQALSADVFIASDGPRISPHSPTIFTGSRGGINFDLVVNLRDGAHHSGNFGGLLADPAIILSHAIASITDSRGQLQIPEWRPTSLTQDIRDVLAVLPPIDAGFELDSDWGESSLTMAERVFGWNSFAVLAMKSGYPEAPVNAISGYARATCQLRYVVGTEANDIISALRQHLDNHGLQSVDIIQAEENPFPATRLDIRSPWIAFIAASLERTCGHRVDLLPNLGGSLPNDCFADVLGLPTIWIPHSYPGCCQHAPNEHLLKSTARQALLCMTGLFVDISASGQQIISGSKYGTV
jgi:acetylornithine deacetylase/succinyl-diaminopimelate desuccinylase-like protein